MALTMNSIGWNQLKALNIYTLKRERKNINQLRKTIL